ncbi:Pkinase-domain-containing protein [Rickenella mellea]|uniref:non-specific serine/threonine protein kinase n=1 Tax=Rickenella mellea TaxID=50990 RepID=A0A4Y7PQZ4_9AGAM|nr:Pkinase-domain-containing protein [Rickenella mellea]
MSGQPSVHQLYKRLETVGKGAYGSVHKGVELATGSIVALKIINLDTEDDDVGDIQREVALLTQLRDAVNITKYFGCYLDGPRVWIVMEYASGGSVRTLMKACKNGTVEERYIVIIVREVLLALNYLHRMGVIHRDIKAANVLVTAVGKVMLCDFGVSALLVTAQSKRNTFVGTPYWMAPEVAQPAPAYDTKADIWSLGITIFEMVTGSPPHAHLQDIKVVQLIPRSKAPRLLEGQGSKDLRDFVAICLKELSADRPTADDLTKTKWIKSTVKTPVSILKEFILQYESWQQAGGTRASIADPLPWEEEEEDELRNPVPTDDENPWEFDTVRGRSSIDDTSARPSLESNSSFDGGSRDPTRRPVNTSRVPASLRSLFDDEAQADPFRMGSSSLARSNSPTPPQFLSSSPARDRAAFKRGLEQNGDDHPTARQTDFAFPPRTSTPRNKTNVPSSLPSSEDEGVTLSPPRRRVPPLGPGIPRGIGGATISSSSSSSSLASIMSDTDHSNSATVRPGLPKPTPTYREVRTSRGVPDISIPPTTPLNPSVDLPSISPTNDPTPPAEVARAPIVPLPTNPRPAFNRKRSQSSAAATSSGRSGQAAALPKDFHFPPVPSRPGQSSSRPQATESRDKVLSPSYAGGAPKSPVMHQSTHSLDNSSTSLSLRRQFDSIFQQNNGGTSLGLPPSLSRAHSANAFVENNGQRPATAPQDADSANLSAPKRRPSLNRQASVAVMETVQSPFGSSSKQFTPGDYPSSGPLHSPTVGLKDVLKLPTLSSEIHLGISDLLPPSPSVASPNARAFPPGPSSLSTSVVPGEKKLHSPLDKPGTLSSSRSNDALQPSPENHAVLAIDSSGPSGPSSPYNPAEVSPSMQHPPSSSSLLGPTVRPLDFGSLMMTHDGTHNELSRTVDELVQWLKVVDLGLSGILDKAGDPTNGMFSELEQFEEHTHGPGLNGDTSLDEQMEAELLSGVDLHEYMNLDGEEDGEDEDDSEMIIDDYQLDTMTFTPQDDSHSTDFPHEHSPPVS